MRTQMFRVTGAAVLTLGLVTTAFTSAQAAPAPTPGTFTRAPISGLASHRSELPALKDAKPKARADVLKRSPSTSSLVAGATGITEMASVCPPNMSLATVYSHESFEAGLPFPDYSDGFTVTTAPGAPNGSSWASSSLLADDPALMHYVNSNYAPVPQTGKVYMSFSYKGEFTDGTVGVEINSDGGTLTPSSVWQPVVLDITSEATTGVDGTVDVNFVHMADAAAGSVDVDNVSLYTCKAPPNSGIRGDWTGQGTVDLMAARTDGALMSYEGNGNGTVRPGVQVGSGWANYTWTGSPGDVNGDRRTDLLARRSDGTMWLFNGMGNGAVSTGKQVGYGWNGLTAIVTPGDFDLDGRPDLIVRRTNGTLSLYRILATGSLTYVRQVGYGWNGMVSIVGMGDVNGDRRGDLLGVRSDGLMFSYLSTGQGFTGTRQVGQGWGGFPLVFSPGDLDGDHRSDLVGRRTNGALWFYPGRAGGGVNAGKQVGTGWNGMASIF